MKSFRLFCLIVLLIGITANSQEKIPDFPVLKGPYLGQKPPGKTPEIFAAGIISTDKRELNSVFSADGKEFFYAINTGSKYVMMHSIQVNGIWTKPETAPFSGRYTDVDMIYSLDGNRLYFCSNRPFKGKPGNMDIWFTDKTQNGWSLPERLGKPINSPQSETYPYFVQNGTIYFASNRPGGKGGKDIYYSIFVNGKYAKPVNLGGAINTEYGEGDMMVAYDESYIVFNSWGRPDCVEGSGDLYISFKRKDGTWTQAKNMGERFNTSDTEYCPILSPDNKYLFFTRSGEIYWVDAKIIDTYRPEDLK